MLRMDLLLLMVELDLLYVPVTLTASTMFSSFLLPFQGLTHATLKTLYTDATTHVVSVSL